MANGEVAEVAGGAAVTPVAVTVEDLPRAIVRRVVREKLAQLASSLSKTLPKGDSSGEGAEEEADVALHKEALLAFSESARIFIHYLSATANDICRESKRQTINAEDVCKALEEIEYPEFIGPLRASLEDYRSKHVAKKAGTSTKKRKMEEPPATDGEVAGAGDAYQDENKEAADGHADN